MAPMKILLATLMVSVASASLCKTSCNGVAKFVACTLSCKGVGGSICENADFYLCKAGCLGIKKCVHKCENKIVKPCIKALVDKCDDKCSKTIVGPCEKQCEKQGMPLCKKAIKSAGTYGCTQICIEAASAAVAAGGGPEDPGADAVASAIATACGGACSAAIKKGDVPGTDQFAEDICKRIGFPVPPAALTAARALTQVSTSLEKLPCTSLNWCCTKEQKWISSVYILTRDYKIYSSLAKCCQAAHTQYSDQFTFASGDRCSKYGAVAAALA